MATKVRLDPETGHYMGLNDAGGIDVFAPEDLPKAVAQGKAEEMPAGVGPGWGMDLSNVGPKATPGLGMDLTGDRGHKLTDEDFRESLGHMTPEEAGGVSPERWAAMQKGAPPPPGAAHVVSDAVQKMASGAQPVQASAPAPDLSQLRSAVGRLLPFGDPDAELRQAQGEASRGRAQALFGQAARALAGRRAVGPEYDKLEAEQAEEPVANLMQRQASERTQAAMRQQEMLRELERQKMDPSSPISTRSRDALAAAAPEFRKRFTDEQWNRLSGNDLAQLGKPMETILTKAAEQENQKTLEAKRAADEAARQKSTQEQQDKERKAREDFEAGQGALNRAAHIKAATEGARAQALAYKKEQNTAYGFEDIDPEHPKALLPAQAESLANASSNRGILKEQLDKLEQLHKANPHPMPNSPEMAQMQAIIAEMQGPVAGTNDYNLTNAHQHLQENMLGDPGKVNNWINSGRLDAQIQTLRHSADTAVRTRAAAFGKKESGAPGAPPPAGEGGTVNVRRKADGKVKAVPTDQAQRFLADPAYEKV